MTPRIGKSGTNKNILQSAKSARSNATNTQKSTNNAKQHNDFASACGEAPSNGGDRLGVVGAKIVDPVTSQNTIVGHTNSVEQYQQQPVYTETNLHSFISNNSSDNLSPPARSADDNEHDKEELDKGLRVLSPTPLTVEHHIMPLTPPDANLIAE